jgi:3-methyl-2-oxobutanoate hydroxymethyltransferase
MATPQRTKVTAPSLVQMKKEGELVTMLTAYDATFARLLDAAGVDVLLVGDSLGMVIQGHASTLPVTLDHVIYHTQAVVRGSSRAHIVADLPFMSYQASVEEGMRSAGRLVKEGGAEAVKLEGGQRHAELVHRLTEIGVPVMGHIGLTPQSIHSMGGYKVQGRSREQGRALVADAIALQEAGVYALVLEGIPSEVSAEITALLDVPTIGIGAGPECDGQVLVIYDLLGMNDTFSPRFVKRYDTLASRIRDATTRYIDEVRRGVFPAPEHSFSRTRSPRASKTAESKALPPAEEKSELAEAIPLYPGIQRR